MALRGFQPGELDQIITFFAPTKSKNAIGEVVSSLSEQGATRAQRIFKSSSEKIDAQQQVGVTMQDFRIYDRRFSITHEWEFNVFSIASPSDVSRYRVRGIQKEGRGNSVIITAEYRDNG
jgi:head-tail adaptor